jgi:16S rRNA (uracil1498-N3)-methyltransferase
MTRRRWIADELSGDRAALVGEHADHLARVLRARLGQEFDIATEAGVRQGRISSIGPDRVEFQLGPVVPAMATPNITLILSIFKFDRMEWAIEKCTELGAARIIPLIARRTEARLASAAAKRVERWERLARQAAEQSRRLAPPEISPPMELKDVVLLPGSARILLAEGEQAVMLRDALESHTRGEDLALAFGPEGGWTDRELQMFRDAGWKLASLGNTILRAETAAIAAMAVVASHLQ